MPGKTKIVTEFRRFQAMFVVEGTIPATVTPGTDSDRFCFDFVFDFDFENRPSFSGWLNFFFFR